jgi:predicted transcriptional regulator
MKKTNNTSSNIVSYIQKHAQATPKELAGCIGVSLQMVHRSLKKLVSEGVLEKKGSPPQVFYSLNDSVSFNEKK